MTDKNMVAESFALAPQWCGISSMESALKLANHLAGSGLVPESYRGKPNDILVAMFWCESLKMPITQGLQSIAVVNGRPSLYGDGALAVIRASGKLSFLDETLEGDEKTGTLTAICKVKRVGEEGTTVRKYSMDDAKRAGLLNRQTYRSYLGRMLQMRARSYALRDKFADVLMGMSLAEEQEDVAFAQGLDETIPAKSEGVTETAEKLPRVKRKRKAKEEQPAEVVDVVEVEAVEAEAVESVEVEPEAEAETVAERVQKCESVHDLMELWRELGITKGHPDANLFSERKAQLEG